MVATSGGVQQVFTAAPKVLVLLVRLWGLPALAAPQRVEVELAALKPTQRDYGHASAADAIVALVEQAVGELVGKGISAELRDEVVAAVRAKMARRGPRGVTPIFPATARRLKALVGPAEGQLIRDAVAAAAHQRSLKRVLPAVKMPDGSFCISDGHHRGWGLQRLARIFALQLRVPVEVERDYSRPRKKDKHWTMAEAYLDMARRGIGFWPTVMRQAHPLHEGLARAEQLRNATRLFAELPRSLDGMHDNPLRVAAKEVVHRIVAVGDYKPKYFEHLVAEIAASDRRIETAHDHWRGRERDPQLLGQLTAALLRRGNVRKIVRLVPKAQRGPFRRKLERARRQPGR